ncbi:HpsJ-like protein, cyanoexosortase A-associated [Fischerella sp. PCC 9605]|uniref:HpsJ-like protein, cyanoexosortase A-associated n=1 Tax=Fischerella sp. PCC 9605 TaxID=1173024 RepID=UPI0004BCDCA3|nr:HpsJ family protein [Fischerella sp. PCC 9605]
MTKPTTDKLIPLLNELQEFAYKMADSMNIFRVLGYGLLLLALFDILEMFIPPGFMNPAWEFQTFGALVERVPVPLIGFVLVFYGEKYSRKEWEFRILKFLSWLTLLLALLFLLLIPLGIANTVRLTNTTVSKINILSQQKLTQAEQLEKQLNQATPEQINNFLKSQGRSLEGQNPQEVKNQILSQISQAKEKIQTQTKATQSSQRTKLLKNSIKWNLGALVSAALFLSIWQGTRWARMN